MAKKKVYAAIEIADQEIRLAVLEVFDARNNILRVEKVPCKGVEKSRIVDEKEVVKAIQQAVKQAQSALGYHIERVLLAIPSRDVKSTDQIIHVSIEDGTHNVRLFHIQQGLNKAMQKRAGDEQELVNINRILYHLPDGTVTPKIPKGLEIDSFDMEVDLLYANKDLLYEYARVIEQANLEILDIVLDASAQGQEDAGLAKSQDGGIIQVSLEADHTTLSLLMEGRLVSSFVLEKGFSSFVKPLQKKYRLSDQTANRLLQNLFTTKKSANPEAVIYIEQQENQRVEITDKELQETVLPEIRSWISDINIASEPIAMRKNTSYIITGQGSNIPVMKEMENAFNAPASVYQVTTIGARDGAFATCLGMAYTWEETQKIRRDERTSVNNNELEESVESIGRLAREQGTEGGFTQKLKKIMRASND